MNTTTDVCAICGAAEVREVVADRTINVGSYTVNIPAAVHTECLSCGESYQTGTQAKGLDAAVIEARRRHEGLLSGGDIRRIRLSVSLSQSDLEDALGIGPKTLVRWENNIGVQSKSIDDVLRLIELDPDNLRLLVRIRSAARTEMFENKLFPQDRIKTGELETAILDGLERASATLGDELTRSITNAVLAAIRAYKHEKIEKLVFEKRIA